MYVTLESLDACRNDKCSWVSRFLPIFTILNNSELSQTYSNHTHIHTLTQCLVQVDKIKFCFGEPVQNEQYTTLLYYKEIKIQTLNVKCPIWNNGILRRCGKMFVVVICFKIMNQIYFIFLIIHQEKLEIAL